MSLRVASVALLVSLPISLQQSTSISIPPAIPSGASAIVSHNFPSLAFETTSFADYAGNSSHPNTFSANLISQLESRLGTGINIRVGGTSGDEDTYVSTQTTTAVIIPPTNSAGNFALYNATLGPSYFEAFDIFKSSTFTWQVPFAHSALHLSADALTQLKLAFGHIALDRLESFEIGNEPNLYNVQPTGKAPDYNETRYVSQWLQHAADIAGNLSLSDKRVFQALTLAWVQNYSQWNTQIAYEDTYRSIDSAGNVKSVCYHYYQRGDSESSTLQELMNHAAIVSNLANTVSDPIDYLQKNHPKTAFVLGEVGSALGNVADAPLEGTLGSALWEVDFLLYAMSLNVSRVNMQQGTGFAYSAWATIRPAPAVHPAYYAMAFVADFIGSNVKNDIRAYNVDLSNPLLTAYAGYDQGFGVQRTVIVDLNMWNSTQASPRLKTTVTLPLPGPSVTAVRVDRLTGAGAETARDVRWNETQWTVASTGLPVAAFMGDSSVQSIASGQSTFSIVVNASEAIMVSYLR